MAWYLLRDVVRNQLTRSEFAHSTISQIFEDWCIYSRAAFKITGLSNISVINPSKKSSIFFRNKNLAGIRCPTPSHQKHSECQAITFVTEHKNRLIALI